jgi:hypothetical protein
MNQKRTQKIDAHFHFFRSLKQRQAPPTGAKASTSGGKLQQAAASFNKLLQASISCG